MSVSKTPTKVTLLPFQQENVASNQQGVPVPAFGGERLLAVRWITPALDKLTVQVKSGGKKG